MSRAPKRRTATDCSAADPGWVVLAPTLTPAEAPAGPLLAENPKAREVKKAVGL